jgi:acyl-CoA synthetase (AMP-forming)/AMP-acid ligase II
MLFLDGDTDTAGDVTRDSLAALQHAWSLLGDPDKSCIFLCLAVMNRARSARRRQISAPETRHSSSEAPGAGKQPLATRTENSSLGPEEQVSRVGSAGRAALNVETRLVDDADKPVPPGTVGEIVHRSPHATLGYYKDEAMTAAAFCNGWFHSGDLGVMTEDGYLTVVDRKKDMIKTGGENVASCEVEEAIYQMPGVAEVAVFGVPHPRWVEAVVAVVVPKPGATLTEEAVITHTRGLLAGYKTPKRVIIADTVPKNPSGKILKRQLRHEHNDLAAQV